MFNNKNKSGGFTLIELMIVIAILGILAAIAIPFIAGDSDDTVHVAVQDVTTEEGQDDEEVEYNPGFESSISGKD